MTNKTKYFQNCLAVFQGGGCKGAAYVGVYRECIARGVFFSEVVGASAGAIIAVFIAAGATPDQLEEIILKLNFSKFQSPPKDIDVKKIKRMSWLKHFIPNDIKQFVPIVSHLGLYKSNYIEDFVAEELKKILKKDSRVKFRDLIIPCSVITSDLHDNDSKIFSLEDSPDEDVALAVRCSANIPLFFQPVDMRYVDGGMISNLPAHLYHHKNKLHSKVLAFSFATKIEQIDIKNIFDYGKSLINTVLMGTMNVQLSLLDNVNIVTIKTGDIKTTDFEKIEEKTLKILIQNGVDAISNFIENETAHPRANTIRSDVSTDYFDTNNTIILSNLESVEEVIISDKQTNWVYELFPTLMKWVDSNVTIKVLLKRNNDDEHHGPYRQRFLEHIGAEIIFADSLPFKGFVFDGDKPEKAKAIVCNSANKPQQMYDSKYYHGNEDRDVVSILHQKLLSNFSTDKSFANVSYIPAKVEELYDKLKSVKQYQSTKIKLSFTEVNISTVVFLTRFIRGFKYRQIEHLFDIYSKNEFELFVPVRINLLNGKSTLITPPVVEKHGNKLYLLEGNTRLTYLYKSGVQQVKVVVVENVAEGLPSSGRYTCNEILITDKKTIGKDRYSQFDYEKFRKIEKAVRNPMDCLL